MEGGEHQHFCKNKNKIKNLLFKICSLNNTVSKQYVKRLTGRLHGTIVGPTGRSDPGYVRLSVRPVGQTVGPTVAEPPTSVNQINVAC